MLKIKYSIENHYQLLMDGQPLENIIIDRYTARPSYGTTGTSDGERFNIWTHDETAYDKIAVHRFNEIPSSVDSLALTRNFSWSRLPAWITIRRMSHEQFFSVGLDFISTDNWTGPYSFADYIEELASVIMEASYPNIRAPFDGDRLPYPDSVILDNIPPELQIGSEIERFSKILNSLDEEVKSRFASRFSSDSLVMSFDFPEEVKVPCEQYLLYFAQFLKDLGVEANTALTHEAGQVLFTVTPDDKQQALDKIRAALEVYLNLPSSPVSDTQQSEIEILRLNAQLQQFQSQLSLARAEIQMKEAAIQLQRVTIGQLSGEVVIDSLKEVTPKHKDKEELLGDIVSLVPLKGKGFEVNLPELFRKLKQLFKDKE